MNRAGRDQKAWPAGAVRRDPWIAVRDREPSMEKETQTISFSDLSGSALTTLRAGLAL